MTRKIKRELEPISRPLEERWDIDFALIGYQDWFDTCFEQDALDRCKKIVITDPEKDLKPILNWLRKQPVHGVDTETTGADKRSGLDPWREGSRLLLLQIGTEEKVCIVQPELVPYFKELLEEQEILKLLQNALYDFKYILAKNDIHINNIHDTMIGEQILTAGLSGVGVGLLDIVRRYKPHRIISKDQRKQFVTFEESGGKFTWEMLYYAARDIVLMFPIYKEQLLFIAKYKLEKIANLEFRLIPAMAMMELGGVYINQTKHRFAIKYWEKRQVELERLILEIYDRELSKTKEANISLFGREAFAFKVKSPAQKLEALKELGFDLEDAKSDTIEGIDHEIAPLLVELSACIKITSTYGEKMLQRINPKTGKLHPKFFQLGAGEGSDSGGKTTARTISTGRESSDFQQLPKDIQVFEEVIDSLELSLIKAQFQDKLDVLTEKRNNARAEHSV